MARVTLLVCVLASLIYPSTSGASEVISTDNLALDLATAHRLLADELFLTGRPQKALEHYEQAEKELTDLKTGLATSSSAKLDLIAAEVAYRKKLAQNGMSFWGAAYSRSPINPVRAYKLFDASVNDLVGWAGKIEKLLNDAIKNEANVAAGVAGINLQEIEQQKNADVAALDQQKAVIYKRDADLQLSILNDRKKAIQQRQSEIQTASQQLQSQLQTAVSGFNKLITQVIAQAIGIPDITVLQDIKDGKSIQSIVIDAASSAIVDPGSQLSQAVATYSESAKKLAEAYREVRSLQSKEKEFEERAHRFIDEVKSKNINELIQVGVAAAANTDNATVATIIKGSQNPTLRSLVNLAVAGRPIREQISAFVGENLDLKAELQPILANAANNNFGTFEETYRSILSSSILLADGTVEKRQTILRLIAQQWPRTIARELLPFNAIQKLAENAHRNCGNPTTCQDQIEEILKSGQLSQFTDLRITPNSVRVTDSKGNSLFEISLTSLAQRLQNRELESSQAELVSKLADSLDRIRSIRPQVDRDFLDRLPDVNFQKEAQTLIDKAAKKAGLGDEKSIASAVLNQISAATREGAVKDVAAFQIGNAIVQSNVSGANNSGPSQDGSSAGSPTAGDGPDPKEQMMLAALTATGPYGAAIAVGIKLVRALGQMSDLSAQINALHAEDQQLTAESIHIEEMVRVAIRDNALADVDEQVAIRKRQAALDEHNVLTTALSDVAAQQAQRVDTAKKMMPLLFLKSEIVRMNFDAFDRSLATWVGDLSQNGQVEGLVRKNNNWTRYELDDDVRLYSWFDRHIEGERKNINDLVLHWQQLQDVAKQVCIEYQCDQDTTVMGQVKYTDELSLKSLVSPQQWEALKNWQTGADSSEQFVLSFLLTPANSGIPSDLEGLRVIDVAVAAEGNNHRSSLVNASLQHTGISFVRIDHQYRQESFFPTSKAVLRFFQSAEKVSEHASTLTSRWKNGPLTLNPMEGYGLYSLYNIVIRREQAAEPDRMTDIGLRFFYFYRNQSAQGNDDTQKLVQMNYQARCESGKELEKLNLRSLEMVLPAAEIVKAGADGSTIRFGSNRCVLDTNGPHQ